MVDVAGCDDGETVVGCETGQQAVGLVGRRVRAGRELDRHVVDPEQAGQPVELLSSRGRTVGGQGRAHRPLAAAGQHQPVAAPTLGQLGKVVDRAPLLVAAQVRVGHRRGEPVVALDAAGQHQEVVPFGIGYAVLRPAQPQRQLGAVDGPERGGGVGRRRLGQHRRAVEAVVVGDGQAVQPEPHRLLHQLRRRRRAVEEAEVAVAVQLGVRRPPAFRIGRHLAGLEPAVLASRDRGVVGAREPGEPALQLLPGHRGVVPAHQSPHRTPLPRASRPGRRAAARPGRRRPRPGTVRTAPRPTTRTRRPARAPPRPPPAPSSCPGGPGSACR